MLSKNKRAISLALCALMLIPLLAACGDDEEKYPGQKAVKYEVNPSDKPILINVRENEKKFLSCVVNIDITNEDDIATLTEKNHWIRDIVIEIGRSKTLEQLQAPNVMVDFGEEVAAAVSEKLQIDSIYQVTFPTFYLN